MQTQISDAAILSDHVYKIRFDPSMDEVKVPIYSTVEGALPLKIKARLNLIRLQMCVIMTRHRPSDTTREVLRALVAEYIRIFDEVVRV